MLNSEDTEVNTLKEIKSREDNRQETRQLPLNVKGAKIRALEMLGGHIGCVSAQCWRARKSFP